MGYESSSGSHADSHPSDVKEERICKCLAVVVTWGSCPFLFLFLSWIGFCHEWFRQTVHTTSTFSLQASTKRTAIIHRFIDLVLLVSPSPICFSWGYSLLIFVANLPQGHSGLLFIIVTVASTPQPILYHKSSLLNPHRG